MQKYMIVAFAASLILLTDLPRLVQGLGALLILNALLYAIRGIGEDVEDA